MAALFVVVYHLGGRGYPILKYGWLGVDVFFTLSGFVVCYSLPANYSISKYGWVFFVKRLLRIHLPYLISLVFSILFYCLSNPTYKINLLDVAYHLFYLQDFLEIPSFNIAYWTLVLEFQFYIFIAFFYQFLVKKWGFLWVVFLSGFTLFFKFEQANLISIFPSFGLGILGYFLYSNKFSKSLLIISICSVAIMGIFGLGYLKIALSAFTLLVILVLDYSNVFFGFFSRISYSLYLTHNLLANYVSVYIGKLLEHNLLNSAIKFSVSFFVAIVTAYVFYFYFEKPFFESSKKFRYN